MKTIKERVENYKRYQPENILLAVAWLIELKTGWGSGNYWTGPKEYSQWGEVDDAVRFSRKVDAEKVITELKKRRGRMTEIIASEHIWVNVSPPPATTRGDGGETWKCAARAQGTAGGNDPAECGWPTCGCDPYADKVIASLQESGLLTDKSAAYAEQKLTTNESPLAKAVKAARGGDAPIDKKGFA